MSKLFNNMIAELKGQCVNLNLDFYNDMQIKNFNKNSFEWDFDNIVDIKKESGIYMIEYMNKEPIGISVI